MRYRVSSINCALEKFKRIGPMSEDEWPLLAPLCQVRRRDSFLSELHFLRLLDRYRDSNGVFVYSISSRGLKRLSCPEMPLFPMPEVWPE